MSYEQRQKERHPDLVLATSLPDISPHQLAGRNARLLLKKAFPGVKFTVASAITGNGDVQKLRVSWTTLPNAPEQAQVQQVLHPFSRLMAGPSPEDNAFRRLFGEVTFVELAHRGPTAEERQAYLKHHLPIAPKACRPRM